MYTYTIGREYYVLGHGGGTAVELDVAQRILDTKTARVADNGRPAQSFIRPLSGSRVGRGRGQELCHVAIRIRTGRRHQIRVHMQHCGFPSVADHRYGLGLALLLGPRCEPLALWHAARDPAAADP
mmetsp:Transcript_45630/g.102664  ORF Transcript_45630/g.102664 Transcript_45630/m.102664 type:complete len:126 (+) Transcript_45630:298-675(+)